LGGTRSAIDLDVTLDVVEVLLQRIFKLLQASTCIGAYHALHLLLTINTKPLLDAREVRLTEPWPEGDQRTIAVESQVQDLVSSLATRTIPDHLRDMLPNIAFPNHYNAALAVPRTPQTLVRPRGSVQRRLQTTAPHVQ